MLRLRKKSAKSQNGNATTTSLMILSGVAAATAAVLTVNQGLRKNRDLSDQTDVERRLNESALQTVTQLVTNGALHYNEKCARLEPTQEFDSSGKIINANYNFPTTGSNGAESCGAITAKRKTIDCSNDAKDAQWLYENDAKSGTEFVSVCVSATEKKAGVVSATKKVVKITLRDYKEEKDDSGDVRRIAIAQSQPQGRNVRGAFYSKLNGKISLGLLKGNAGLLGKHGAADTCFYMRPITSQQKRGQLSAKNLAFNARSKSNNFDLSELEPRPDGPNQDEYSEQYNVNTSVPEGYEVLSTYRDKIIESRYKADLRGYRPASDNWSTKANAWIPNETGQDGRAFYTARVLTGGDLQQSPGARAPFIGVMPTGVQPDGSRGPEFKYFLAADTKGKRHRQDRTVFAPAYFGEFKKGCESSTKDSKATFCTRVDVPLKSYTAAFNTRCETKTQSIPPVGWQAAREVRYANRAVLTSCNKEWIKTVQDLLTEESEQLQGLQKPDEATTAEMVFAALEVDDNFLQKTGRWTNHPIRKAYDQFQATLEKNGGKVIDTYTVAYEGDKDEGKMVPVLDAAGTQIGEQEVITYKAKVVTHEIPMIKELSSIVKEDKYEAKSCAYFKYYDPTNPKTCSISFVTKDQKGYVCRNNDGCFDEKTTIRMADGSHRLVTELRTGEYVYNPVTKRPAKITKLTIGPELKPLLNVTIGGSTVRVTDSHPFMTKRGWVAAKNLLATDRVLAQGGQYLKIEKVEIGLPGRTVANLALEGPAHQPELHYVLADGVVTGDLVIQNMLEQRAVLTDESRGK